MNLSGSRVLITGASRGIGEAIARQVAGAGAVPILVARDGDRLAQLASELHGIALAGDLLDPDFAHHLIAQAVETGPIDVLINNAGIEKQGDLADQSVADITSVLRLNVEVPAILMNQALPAMVRRKNGHVVNVSSLAMAINTPGWATYSASKAALSSLSSSVRHELAGTNVGLTLVEIGAVDTDMMTALRSPNGAADAQFDRYERLGLSPMLKPHDVAVQIRRAIQNNTTHVRMPKRAVAFPMIANAPRRIADMLQRGA